MPDSKIKCEDAPFDGLLQWLQERHGMSSELPVCLFAEEGMRGIAVSSDIKARRQILHLPSSALLNMRTLRHIYPQSLLQDLTAFQLLSLHLALHRSLQPCPTNPKTELWLPFIATLPKEFPELPLWWMAKDPNSRECKTVMQLLANSPARFQEVCHKVAERFAADWEATKAVLARQDQQATRIHDCALSTFAPSKEDFLWAWCNVNTRCLSHDLPGIPDQANRITLAPLLDLVNHSDESRVKVISSHTGLSIYSTPLDDITQDSGSTALHKNRELTFQYGAHDSATLVGEYGFFIKHNRHATVDATPLVHRELDGLPPEEQAVKRSMLRDTGHYDKLVFNLYQPFPDSKPQPSWSLLVALRLVYCGYEAAVDDRDADDPTQAKPNKKKRTSQIHHAGRFSAFYAMLTGSLSAISSSNEALVQEGLEHLAHSLNSEVEPAQYKMSNLEILDNRLMQVFRNISSLWDEQTEMHKLS